MRNRAFLTPTEPRRDERYYTVEGQQERLDATLAAVEEGRGAAFAIVDDDEMVGGISLVGITGFPLHAAVLGYWVDEAHNGRGLASRAVAEILELAFGEHELHRVEAGTLPDNLASQRVLEKNGFTRIGLSRRHLLVDGVWRDHVLFERVAGD